MLKRRNRVKITRITQQKNDKERYNLYLDGDFWLGVDESVLVKFALFKDIFISDSTKQEVEDYEYRNKYYHKALKFLGSRMKSTQEVACYLSKHIQMADNFMTEEQVIAWVIEKLSQQGYLNDLEYAKAFVRHQARIQQIGPKKIEQQLYQKGIDKETLLVSLEEYSQDQITENLEKTIQKYLKKHTTVAQRLLKTKLYQHLNHKGFTQEHISQVNLENFIDRDAETEQEILNQDMQKIHRKFEKKYAEYELYQKVVQAGMRKGHNYEAIQAWMNKKEEMNDDE